MDIKRMDYVQRGDTIFLVTLSSEKLELWDFQAWLKGFYDAYIPLNECSLNELKVIGNFKDNPELLPAECEGYNGEPHPVCLGTIFKNPAFNPEYAITHKYEHSCGYPDDRNICVCGKDIADQIHIR